MYRCPAAPAVLSVLHWRRTPLQTAGIGRSPTALRAVSAACGRFGGATAQPGLRPPRPGCARPARAAPAPPLAAPCKKRTASRRPYGPPSAPASPGPARCACSARPPGGRPCGPLAGTRQTTGTPLQTAGIGRSPTALRAVSAACGRFGGAAAPPGLRPQRPLQLPAKNAPHPAAHTARRAPRLRRGLPAARAAPALRAGGPAGPLQEPAKPHRSSRLTSAFSACGTAR